MRFNFSITFLPILTPIFTFCPEILFHMAIRVTLDRMLLERKLSLTQLCERVGITLANLSVLKTGKAKAIRFSTLSALCRELRCQPADLLFYENPGEPDT